MKELTLSIFLIFLIVPFVAVGQAKTKNKIPTLTKLWETDTLLTANESAIYDKRTKAIYVSCMGGSDDVTDGDGFIAKISLEGKIEKLHWVNGLDAPKGLAIYKNNLFTIDINQLITIDLKTGKILSRETVSEENKFNDIDIDEKTGDIYLSENYSGEVAKYQKGKLEKIFKTEKTTGRPNGVMYKNNAIHFTTARGGIYKLINSNPVKIADGCFYPDGLEAYKSGFFCSSWKGKIYYFMEGGDTHKLIDLGLDGQFIGDIDVVEKDGLLICPTLFNNKLVVYKIE